MISDSSTKHSNQELEVGNQQAGRIDIHSHLLPGIDDGCQRIEESLACIHRLRAAGYVGTVCTPHILPSLYPENDVEHIAGWIDSLRERLADEGIDYGLWPGGEVRLDPDTVSWFEEGRDVPTLAGGPDVLVDYFGPTWPTYADAGIDWLLEQGYRPILAHPERMGLRLGELLDVTGRLLERGVRLQCNARSAAGLEGPTAEASLHELLGGSEVFAFALDMHGYGSLEGRLAGLESLAERYGLGRLQAWVAEAPRQILSAAEVACP